MKTIFQRWMRVAIAAIASMMIGMPAHAVTIGAIWDPMFGGPLNSENLWWSGQAQFSFPDGCLAEANTSEGAVFVANGSPYGLESSCFMQLDSASVTLYNNPPGPSGGTSLYTFTSDAFCCESEGMWIKNVNGMNAVVGIQTEQYSFFSFGPDPTSGGVYSGPLWLWFTSPPGGEFDPAHASTNCGSAGEPFPCDGANSDPALLSSITTCTDDGVCVTVSIPEPGTLGLALGSLAAIWLARRRRVNAFLTA